MDSRLRWLVPSVGLAVMLTNSNVSGAGPYPPTDWPPTIDLAKKVHYYVADGVFRPPNANRALPADRAHLTLLTAGGRDYVGGYSLGGWGRLWRFGGFNVSPEVAIPIAAATLHYIYNHPPPLSDAAPGLPSPYSVFPRRMR